MIQSPGKIAGEELGGVRTCGSGAELGELNDKLDQALKYVDEHPAVEQNEGGWEKVGHLGFRVIAKPGDTERGSGDRDDE